jgi:hypothetical protein
MNHSYSHYRLSTTKIFILTISISRMLVNIYSVRPIKHLSFTNVIQQQLRQHTNEDQQNEQDTNEQTETKKQKQNRPKHGNNQELFDYPVHIKQDHQVLQKCMVSWTTPKQPTKKNIEE